MKRGFIISLLLHVWLVIGLVGCAQAVSHPLDQFQEGQIFDLETGKAISFEEMKPPLLNAQVVYIGEEHYTPSHIQTAIQIIDMLLKNERNPVLAMEMFSWDGQEGIDQYLKGDITTSEQFLQESLWDQNWDGDFDNYEKLVNLAKLTNFSLFALNPPRSLVRMVARQGLAQAQKSPEMGKWGMDFPISLDDPEYYRVLFEQIEKCHPGMPKKAYQRFYEASIFKDEGMARVIVDYLKTKGDSSGLVVSYTGGGHIQYRLPIPNRVERQSLRPVKSVTVYLIALDLNRQEEVRQAIKDRIADYIWLTPLGPRGPQRRCG